MTNLILALALTSPAFAFKIDKYDLGKSKCPFTTSSMNPRATFLNDFEGHLTLLGLIDREPPELHDENDRPACSSGLSYSKSFEKKSKKYCNVPNRFFYADDVTCLNGVVVAYSKHINESSLDKITEALNEKYKAEFEPTKSYSDRFNNMKLAYGKNADVRFIVEAFGQASAVIYFTAAAAEASQKNITYQIAELRKQSEVKPLKDEL